MQKVFEIIMEIIRRPELWNVPRPDVAKIAQTLCDAGVYSRKSYKKDNLFSINKYLTIILEMKRQIECQMQKEKRA